MSVKTDDLRCPALYSPTLQSAVSASDGRLCKKKKIIINPGVPINVVLLVKIFLFHLKIGFFNVKFHQKGFFSNPLSLHMGGADICGQL